ncbi:hypothetical protein GCM10009737_07550 [Nocardioides lentus]|uniref:DUF559 domain-containing protein n=2 Tax=Nocardioides lentus TaxID=338077 RepID=A0ABN2P1P7_9ACTN
MVDGPADVPFADKRQRDARCSELRGGPQGVHSRALVAAVHTRRERPPRERWDRGSITAMDDGDERDERLGEAELSRWRAPRASARREEALRPGRDGRRAPAGGPVRGNVRSPRYRRVSHGLFLPVQESTTERAEWLRDLRAWREVLPESAVFTGLTAARLAGWWCPPLPTWAPVFAAVSAGSTCPQRSGLVVSRYRRRSDHRTGWLEGLPVDGPAEVLLRCARDLDLLDLVPLVESALRSGAVTAEHVTELCESRRPGVRVLRRALALSYRTTESAGESLLRLFMVVMGVDVEVQPTIRDQQGAFVARADLRVRGTPLLFEYDGAVHRSRAAQHQDLRRERTLVQAGQQRRGYTAEDLVRHPAVVMGEVDRALARDTDLGRLRTWRRLLDRSAYTEAGRARLRTRWAVRMDVFGAG